MFSIRALLSIISKFYRVKAALFFAALLFIASQAFAQQSSDFDSFLQGSSSFFPKNFISKPPSDNLEPGCFEPETLENIEVTDSKFSITNAANFMWFGWLIEKSDAEIKKFLNKTGIGIKNYRIIDIPGYGKGVFVIEVNDQIIVITKGTHDVLDLMTDIVLGTTDGASSGLPGRVHAGFLFKFNLIWPQIRTAIYELNHGTKPIWFVGHSMGGALSTFAAYKMAQENQTVLGVYTFGAPLAGNADFSHAYNDLLKSRTFVVKFGEDIVARLPPSVDLSEDFSNAVTPILRERFLKLSSQIKYTHFGTHYNVDNEHELTQEDDPNGYDKAYWKKLTQGSLLLPMSLIFNKNLIGDHMSEKYYCHFHRLSQQQ